MKCNVMQCNVMQCNAPSGLSVELDEYWKRLIALDKVTDFSKHHCSQELKEFLQVDDAINGKERGIFWVRLQLKYID